MVNETSKPDVPLSVKVAAYLIVVGTFLLEIYTVPKLYDLQHDLELELIFKLFRCMIAFGIGRELLQLSRSAWKFVIYFQGAGLVLFLILVVFCAPAALKTLEFQVLLLYAASIYLLLLSPSSRRVFRK